jgi:hypothetical protein
MTLSGQKGMQIRKIQIQIKTIKDASQLTEAENHVAGEDDGCQQLVGHQLGAEEVAHQEALTGAHQTPRQRRRGGDVGHSGNHVTLLLKIDTQTTASGASIKVCGQV